MIFVFAIYLALVIGIAVWAGIKSKTKNDFVLGGKKIGGQFQP